MKTKKYLPIIFFLLALVGIINSSCKKVLEQEPKNSTYAEVFWQNSRDLKSAIAGNYALVRDAITSKNNRYFLYSDAIAKNYFTIQYTGDGLEGIQNGNFTFQYNVVSLGSLGDWTKYYKAIAMSNTILKRVPEIKDDKLGDVTNPVQFRNEILGQALFLRAWTYFMMVKVWGDVPLVTEAYDDPLSAPQLGRTPKAEVMKQVEDDCHAALGLLNWGYTNVGDAKVTANKGSLYALLVHLYLWRATMADLNSDAPNMTDVNSADTSISMLMAKGGYALTDTSRYYQTFIGRSTESIFEINMSENTMEGSQASIGMDFLRGDKLKNWNGDNPRYYVAPGYLDKHFLIRQPVAADWYWNGTEWIWMDEQPAIYDSMDVRYRKNFDYTKQLHPACIKYSNVIYRNPGQELDPYLSNNLIVFRLADMMLLQAEIALYKNNPDQAIDIINFFRIRNGASEGDPADPDDDKILEHGMSREDVMQEYVIERGKELYLEGHIFYDLLRTRMYKNFIDWLPEDGVRFKNGGFYFPVSPLLFKQNPYLKQTPYWVGKV